MKAGKLPAFFFFFTTQEKSISESMLLFRWNNFIQPAEFEIGNQLL